MSGTWGKNIELSLFGESHGDAIGITINGLEPGIKLDLDYIKEEMARRAPGQNDLSTPRKEKDEFHILSGYFNGRTTGTPLTMIIYNTNQHSRDYEKTKNIMRPSHGDFTGYIKYKGFNDYRGGGHFSGRITAPLVFAGAICKQILMEKGIIIGSHIKSIKNIKDEDFTHENLNESTLKFLRKEEFPVLNIPSGDEMKKLIKDARVMKDSVGGIVECTAINLPVGLGDPFFDSVESTLSSLLFSIPGVKGVEFGIGFGITELYGSEANDQYVMDNEKIKTITNNNGGILGGITSGMPLVFRAAMKPTPSIGKRQKTIDISTMEECTVEIAGRHDPCIVVRALPVVEAAAAIAILELLKEMK